MELVNLKSREEIENALDDSFNEALTDETFKKLCNKVKAPEKIMKKNTSKLQETVKELTNCKKCKGIFECQNKVCGYVCYPNYENGYLDFIYTPCKYQKEMDYNKNNKMTSAKELEFARMKDIDVSDLNRAPIIKWLKNFYDNYDGVKELKGLYLHGNFGCGKTFLISALFNELRINKRVSTEIVYFPEILRILKDDWSLYNSKVNYYQEVDLLLIDDIGAEKVSEWGRDEVLGTILQSRMNNKLPTFFTSNLNISELETHLALAKNSEDYVKSRRIIERIKQLTEDKEMISENKRK